MADKALLRRLAGIARRLPLSTIETAAAGIREQGKGTGAPRSGLDSELDQLERDWLASGQLSSELASALEAAAMQDEWWRDHQGVGLVWTGPVQGRGTLRRTEQALLEVIESSRDRLWLVSFAGYGVRNIRDALRRAAARGVEVLFVIESPEESEGKVTFSALQGIDRRLAEVATVLVWPRGKRATSSDGKVGSLHVKCVLADTQKLFVSSANLTDYAMTVNMELGVLIDGGNEPQRLAKHLEWLVSERHLVALGVR